MERNPTRLAEEGEKVSRKTMQEASWFFAEHPYAYRYVSVKRWACRTLRFWGEAESSHEWLERVKHASGTAMTSVSLCHAGWTRIASRYDQDTAL